MKTKKLTAIILAGALSASALCMTAFAEDAKPTVTVYGSSVAKETGSNVNLNVRLADFAGVAGMDIKIEGEGLTLESPESKEIDLAENSNYVIKDNVLHIVELNTEKKSAIKIKIPAKTTAENSSIKVSVAKLAKDGKTLLDIDKKEYEINNGNGKVAVVPENKRTDKDLQDNKDTFYPYGSVYTGDTCTDATRLNKDGKGKFTITESTTYKAFAKPANGILTFGTGKKTGAQDKENNLQFGTYTDKTGVKNGTMLIVGSWENYIDYRIKESGLTAEDALKEMYNADPVSGKDYAKVYYENAAGERKAVLVYKKPRTTYTWKMADDSAMEYALRVYDSGKYTCTAVGYYESEGNVVFSSRLKSNNLK